MGDLTKELTEEQLERYLKNLEIEHEQTKEQLKEQIAYQRKVISYVLAVGGCLILGGFIAICIFALA